MDFRDKKILIAGVGGVGGFIGGALAKAYDNVYFFARSERKTHIRHNGITVKSKHLGDFTAQPKAVIDSANGEIMDIVFICVKNFSLDTICQQIIPMISENTIIVPLLNGIEVNQKLNNYFSGAVILEGFLYIIATAMPDFSIIENGGTYHVHIGKTNPSEKEKASVDLVAELLKQANLKCYIEDDILSAIWQKFITNCAFNVTTAYYLTDTDGVRNHPDRLAEYITLVNEASLTARVSGINIPQGFEQSHITNFIEKQLGAGTSSLKKDMAQNMPSEVDIFGGALLAQAKKVGLILPMTQRFYNEMKNKK